MHSLKSIIEDIHYYLVIGFFWLLLFIPMVNKSYDIYLTKELNTKYNNKGHRKTYDYNELQFDFEERCKLRNRFKSLKKDYKGKLEDAWIINKEE